MSKAGPTWALSGSGETIGAGRFVPQPAWAQQHMAAVTAASSTLPGHRGHRALLKPLVHSRVGSDPWDPPAAREKGCSSGQWKHLNKRALLSIGLSDMLQTKPAWIWHISQATVTERPFETFLFPGEPFLWHFCSFYTVLVVADATLSSPHPPRLLCGIRVLF